MTQVQQPCPCGLGLPYAQCCGPVHSGHAKAASAEQLMRSRFSAFARNDEAYLLASWHPSTRPSKVEFDPDQRWTSLEIIARTGGGPFHTEGTVEFRAHYRSGGVSDAQQENSMFTRVEGSWFYLGTAPTSAPLA